MISHSNLTSLISIPVVSACIGYVTNYIAVKMLFRPHQPRRFLGIRFHGLVPKRQAQIAESLGRMIERDLFSHRDIQEALQSAETSQEAAAFLHEQVDVFVQKITAQNPMIGAFLQGPLLQQVKDTLSGQMAERFPQLIERIVDKVEHRLDVSAIVERKIAAFDLSKLESLIYEISKRELKTIELLGGVLGFLVGIVQVALMLLISAPV
jgi:uncharacterized membrane protein YheB (UPF0754 family)